MFSKTIRQATRCLLPAGSALALPLASRFRSTWILVALLYWSAQRLAFVKAELLMRSLCSSTSSRATTSRGAGILAALSLLYVSRLLRSLILISRSDHAVSAARDRCTERGDSVRTVGRHLRSRHVLRAAGADVRARVRQGRADADARPTPGAAPDARSHLRDCHHQHR